MPRCDEGVFGPKLVILCSQEKLLSVEVVQTVLQTNSGGQGENPKAFELNHVKELGKLPPYLRYKVGQQCEGPRARSIVWLQKRGGSDCLSKTQHYANS